MTVRSIIDVDMQTAAWERFQQQWDKYQETLRKQPEIWKKIGAEQQRITSSFAAFGTKMDTHLASLEDAKTLQIDQEKSLTHSASLWSDIQKASGNTAKHVGGATTSLLKWTGLLSGAAGVLGYFSLHGMMGLGSNVFDWRKSAMGLGVTTGQQRAFDIAFGRLLGSPTGFLGGINNAVSNLSQQAPLYALGVNPNGSTSDVAVATLQKLFTMAHNTPRNQLGILEQMYGLGNLGVSTEDLVRFQQMPESEFKKNVLGTYRQQQGVIGLSDRTAKAWTDFITNMDLAKARIANVFVKGLEGLTGPVSNLATGLTHLLEVVMAKNGGIERDIDGIAAWMQKFNGQISKPDFIRGLQDFVNLVSDIERVMHRATTPVHMPGAANPHKVGAAARSWFDRLWGAQEQWWHGSAGSPIGMLLNNPGNLKFAGQAGATLGQGGFAKFGSMSEGLTALARQFSLYGSRGIDTVGSIVSTYAPASDRNNVPAYIKAIDRELGVSSTQHLNLSDPKVLAELMRAVIRQEMGVGINFNGAISAAARNATRSHIEVKIENNTGGSTAASVSGLAARK